MKFSEWPHESHTAGLWLLKDLRKQGNINAIANYCIICRAARWGDYAEDCGGATALFAGSGLPAASDQPVAVCCTNT